MFPASNAPSNPPPGWRWDGKAPRTAGIYVVRHAQASHNVSGRAAFRRDTHLTTTGLQQSKDTGKMFYDSKIRLDHIICSPLTRTIQTCSMVFNTAVARGVPIVLVPDLRETSDYPCNYGRSLKALDGEFGSMIDGTEYASGGWHDEAPPSDPAEMKERGRRLRNEIRKNLAAYMEKVGARHVNIGIVSHANMLRELTGDYIQPFYNAENRLYEIPNLFDDRYDAYFQEPDYAMEQRRLARNDKEAFQPKDPKQQAAQVRYHQSMATRKKETDLLNAQLAQNTKK
ncbi:hypothetical protein M426DRAFT_26022 [Hypoxylon sp. CI-4A]|nr:hypothetical protein M426DRAFT_26022 [Hypoxylon sp. CI-4A]